MKLWGFNFCACSRSDVGTEEPMRASNGVGAMGSRDGGGVKEEAGGLRLGVACGAQAESIATRRKIVDANFANAREFFKNKSAIIRVIRG